MPRKNKRPKRREFWGDRGVKYKSKAEQTFALLLEKRNIHALYEPDRFDWVPPLRKYTPDFKIQREDGSILYIEVKGYFKSPDRTKMKCFKQQHPNIDVRLVFLNAKNRINKNSKTTYGDWADQHGFPWSDKGRLPMTWLKSPKRRTKNG